MKIKLLGARWVACTGNNLRKFSKDQILTIGKDISRYVANGLLADGFAEEVE